MDRAREGRSFARSGSGSPVECSFPALVRDIRNSSEVAMKSITKSVPTVIVTFDEDGVHVNPNDDITAEQLFVASALIARVANQWFDTATMRAELAEIEKSSQIVRPS